MKILDVVPESSLNGYGNGTAVSNFDVETIVIIVLVAVIAFLLAMLIVEKKKNQTK
jgi:hypothetical protein